LASKREKKNNTVPLEILTVTTEASILRLMLKKESIPLIYIYERREGNKAFWYGNFESKLEKMPRKAI
jgi:hypothetical protein